MASPSDLPAHTPGAGHHRSFAAFRTISALMLREMSTRYGRSPGGYVWALLEPLGAILILGAGFSLIIRNPPIGNSFLIFYATGFLPFSLYQNLSNAVARAINFSRPLLMYPAVSWIDAVFARFILNSLTNILVAYLLMAGLLMVTDTRTVLDIGPIVTSFTLAMLLGLAIGTLNCALIGLYPTWEVIWSIATRPLFLASAIFFTFDSLPRAIQDILWWNPLVHIVGEMRSGFYPMYRAQYVDNAYVLTVSLVTLLFGLLLMRRFHRDILND
ncbi:ABC transporter permease [Thalassobius vesicularis]|nr:ABC transporter permease [Thalassobius vesicularis]